MRILHYSLGFPPYRSGGLTKFCMDLMREQVKMGHEVGLLWPGRMRPDAKDARVEERRRQDGIRNLELINPLPIPYDEGICDIAAFTAPCPQNNYGAFLAQYQPEVIHIHTLMGLHKEFLEESRKRGIRIVFTVHDFFPICPKVTLFRHGTTCKTVETCEECPQCNSTALSLQQIRTLQSPAYRTMKDSPFVRRIRKGHRDRYLSGESERSGKENRAASVPPDAYKRLRSAYAAMISQMDVVHYNSSMTKRIFETFFPVRNSCVITVTHADIQDHRMARTYGETLRLAYLGPQSEAKGYFLLKEALDQLWTQQNQFSLTLYFEPTDREPYMNVREHYGYGELEDVFGAVDLVLVPSLWHETFGYTVLEALSYGVPVLISDQVGARDILPEGCGIVLESIDAKKLADTIRDLSPERLAEMNRAILEKAEIKTLEDMARDIMRHCYGATGGI